MAEPARFSAEGSQSMPRQRKTGNADRSQVQARFAWRALNFPFDFQPENTHEIHAIHYFSTLRHACAGRIGGSLCQRQPCGQPRP